MLNESSYQLIKAILHKILQAQAMSKKGVFTKEIEAEFRAIIDVLDVKLSKILEILRDKNIIQYDRARKHGYYILPNVRLEIATLINKDEEFYSWLARRGIIEPPLLRPGNHPFFFPTLPMRQSSLSSYPCPSTLSEISKTASCAVTQRLSDIDSPKVNFSTLFFKLFEKCIGYDHSSTFTLLSSSFSKPILIYWYRYLLNLSKFNPNTFQEIQTILSAPNYWVDENNKKNLNLVTFQLLFQNLIPQRDINPELELNLEDMGEEQIAEEELNEELHRALGF